MPPSITAPQPDPPTPSDELPGHRDGPLETLRVLEIGDRGEIAGKLLADAGADVIRIEPPGGGRSRHVGPFVDDDPGQPSLLHATRNTSKRAVTLDVTQPAGLEIWQRLVGRVDVVIDATTPTFLDALGGGWQWAEAQPDLHACVWCSITPFGRTGPRRDWAANDLVQLALGGPMMSNGYDEHHLPPIRPDGEHSIAISNEYAVTGLLAALWMRNAGHRGQLVDVSIHEAVSATTEGAFPNWEYFGRLVQRQTGRHSSPDPTAPWQHLAADGQHVCLINGGLPRGRPAWSGLLDWMDEHDAADDLRDPQYQELLFSDPTLPPLKPACTSPRPSAPSSRACPPTRSTAAASRCTSPGASSAALKRTWTTRTGPTAASSGKANAPAPTTRSATPARPTASPAPPSASADARRCSASTTTRSTSASSA